MVKDRTEKLKKARKYCKKVDQNEDLRKQLIETISIKDDNSSLIGLKESGFNLIFEPSFRRNYQYLVREAVFEKIGRISDQLNKQNMVLIIRSTWRSFKHQQILWRNCYRNIRNEYPTKQQKEIREIVSNFIAPKNESMHSTGGAVDALIYDSENNCVLNFGTNNGYKINLNKRCYPLHPNITLLAKRNRKLLINLFEEEDFICDLKEYWHFDYGNTAWAAAKEKKYAKYGLIPTMSFDS